LQVFINNKVEARLWTLTDEMRQQSHHNLRSTSEILIIQQATQSELNDTTWLAEMKNKIRENKTNKSSFRLRKGRKKNERKNKCLFYDYRTDLCQ